MADWDWGAAFGDGDEDDNEEGGFQKVTCVFIFIVCVFF